MFRRIESVSDPKNMAVPDSNISGRPVRECPVAHIMNAIVRNVAYPDEAVCGRNIGYNPGVGLRSSARFERYAGVFAHVAVTADVHGNIRSGGQFGHDVKTATVRPYRTGRQSAWNAHECSLDRRPRPRIPLTERAAIT